MNQASQSGKKKIWYVFTSTRWQMVNLAAAAAIGFDGIDHILILVPKSRDGSTRDVDHRHAVAPRDAILAAIRLGWDPSGRIGVSALEGDLDDLNHWRSALPAFFAERPGPLEIIFNYTGGPKDVSLGGVLGLQDLARDKEDATVRFVAKHACCLTWPFEERRMPIDPGANSMPLAVYLAAHGYDESHPGEREAREQEALARQARTNRLTKEVFAGGEQTPVNERLALLNRLPSERFFDPVSFAGQDGGPGVADFARRLAGLLDGVAGVERRGGMIRVSAPAQRYVGGGWFEEWIWLRARQGLANSNAAVFLGVKLVNRSAPNGEDLDIDVALFCGNQLHAVECKTGGVQMDSGRRRRDSVQKELDHLAHVKETALGPFGKAWLFRARPYRSLTGAGKQAKSYSIARRLGLRLAAGESEIEAELRTLPRLTGTGVCNAA